MRLWPLLPALFLLPALTELWSRPARPPAVPIDARSTSREPLPRPATLDVRSRVELASVAPSSTPIAAEPAAPIETPMGAPAAPQGANGLPEELVRERFRIEERLRNDPAAPDRAALQKRIDLLSATLAEVRKSGRFAWFLPPIGSADDAPVFERDYAAVPAEDLAVEHWMLDAVWQLEREQAIDGAIAAGRFEMRIFGPAWG
jgi:hypothetical protein